MRDKGQQLKPCLKQNKLLGTEQAQLILGARQGTVASTDATVVQWGLGLDWGLSRGLNLGLDWGLS